MSSEKIKVKELALELDVPTKDLLRVLRELNITAKSTMSSIDLEDIPKVREHFTGSNDTQKTERTQVQPGVIIRRKRKTSPHEQTTQSLDQPTLATNDPTETLKSTPEDTLIEKNITQEQKKPIPKSEESIDSRVDQTNVLTSDGVDKEQITSTDKKNPVPTESEQSLSEKKQSSPPHDSDNTTELESQHDLKKMPRKPAASASPEGSSAPTLLPPVIDQTRRQQKVDNAQPTGNTMPHTHADDHAKPQVRVISRPTPPPNVHKPTEPSAFEQRPNVKKPSETTRTFHTDSTNDYLPQPKFITPPPVGGVPPLEHEAQNKKKRNAGKKSTEFTNTRFRDDEDDMPRQRRHKKKHKQQSVAPQTSTQPLKAIKRKIRIDEAIRVADIAHQMGLKSSELIKVLFNLGIMATVNQSLDIDTATVIAAEFDYEVEKVGFAEEDYLPTMQADPEEALKPRPPVVTIMGHVDHGKTSLLDAIRQTNVTGGEAGGITQHIGAYHVTTKSGDIVFLDTPGHEAFTTMRARGAQVTDIVVLVVAADDGVMEQTREAINHARAAQVPIMVAVNKIDKPDAAPDVVLRELSEVGLVPEDWGGDTVVAKVSAKTFNGIDELLELLALQADIMELKANPDKPAKGHIIEAKLDKGRGPIATVLIQEGTLRQGDTFVCGVFSGRVRAMFDDQGKKVTAAGPSMPVEVQGFDGVPEAGEAFICLPDEKLARRIAESRAVKQRERELAKESRITLETFLAKTPDTQEARVLNLIVKSDVQGSLEAIIEALRKLTTEKVRINIIHGGSGAITESDILLASASDAIVIGFNVKPTAKVKEVSERENVDIRFYDIIYKLVDEIKNAMVGLLAPVSREVYLGQAEVRETFSVPKVGIIAGSHVSDGKIIRNALIRLLREGVVIHTGKISSLRRFKDDAKEVQKGYECGIGIENFNDVKIGDVIEAFETVEEAATL